MRKNDQNHCVSVVVCANKGSARALGRGTHSKNPRQSPHQLPTRGGPHVASATHLGRRMGTAQSASTMGDLRATHKRQFRHRVMSGNWNISSLRGKEHELVEKVKLYSPDVVGISWTKLRVSNIAELDDGWNLFYSGVEPAQFAQA